MDTAINTENMPVNEQDSELEEKEKAGESKAEKFVRLAELRMTKALKGIENLANLSNRSSYEYTDEQVKAMLAKFDPDSPEVKRLKESPAYQKVAYLIDN